ncbi:hypothetical protein RHMOL_Rhmol07G0188000 [Rhododendron molle]|uniref:Uncharacterized protein n=1 Tax=Rhododendron molle TaxID=49168 RepID=A0ACC0N202_RHOML|nr:hypothetical protein RHMOL_Rhmol07G0188000 [Rhododendron molle]
MAFDGRQVKKMGQVLVCSIVGLVLGLLVFTSTTVTAAKGYAGINPARCFGPAVMRGGHLWDGHWIFWVGPTLASRKALASAESNQNGVNGVQRASSSEGMVSISLRSINFPRRKDDLGLLAVFFSQEYQFPQAHPFAATDAKPTPPRYEECGKEKINRFLLLRRGTDGGFVVDSEGYPVEPSVWLVDWLKGKIDNSSLFARNGDYDLASVGRWISIEVY